MASGRRVTWSEIVWLAERLATHSTEDDVVRAEGALLVEKLLLFQEQLVTPVLRPSSRKDPIRVPTQQDPADKRQAPTGARPETCTEMPQEARRSGRGDGRGASAA